VTNDEIDALDDRCLAEGRLDEVLARHLPDLRDRARVRMRDAALADDVVQQALERVLREVRRDAWARAGAGREVPLDPGDGPDDDGGLGEVVARGWFDQAVAGLPDRDREVMRMRVAEGREPAEIAEALGITANAVHQAIHRGRRALREAWTA
jgi:DNA-directed RNA polymerase specialized sigma24 family protein